MPDDLTIEHILPEVWHEHWPLADGSRAAADSFSGMSEAQIRAIAERESLKHTLGNLSLLTGARNPSLGNLGFAIKRETLRQSNLKLNRLIASDVEWNEKAIRDRSAQLAQLVAVTWPGLAG